ncbi:MULTISPECIES: hypothetical protein [unclassified Sphingomonas]|uniref:hypothetical protein n=1 Tax=unclassified Sphingomonas TaxID=196159 RepID=UPI0025869228|nr:MULTISPECIES: hypothetical protein [unclassified Sphingomonas]
MLETAVITACAWLLLAGASFRHRHATGEPGRRAILLLRLGGWTILAAALMRSGTDIGGERIVRMLASASLSGGAVVLALSVRPAVVLAPVRLLLGLSRRTEATSVAAASR